tara:strand:+ start:596 stop:2794 length:2199 start_codon:yes stop_codon:yes gene_type:complete
MAESSIAAPQSNWFVGASYGGIDDQSERFLQEGIWENGYEDKYLDLVRSMQPGDRIAIKSAYTRKYELPFNNRGNTVSVMAIKAVGTITENLSDGRTIRVNWDKLDPAREWYFYTNRGTIWRVVPGDWRSDGLLAFTFEGVPQDIVRFCNAPYWRDRFGQKLQEGRFLWTAFYEAVAEKLLEHRSDRTRLVEGIHGIASRVQGLSNLQDKFAGGTTGPLEDICPFTAMGIFNRSVTHQNRRMIAGEFAEFLGVDVAVPETFEGIPVLNNQRSWFFAFSDRRGAGDIDSLWRVFTSAAEFVASGSSEQKARFLEAYDRASDVWGVSWNLSTGLYWAHPWDFPTLDVLSREYIEKHLGQKIPITDQPKRCRAEDYLKLTSDLLERFGEDSYPVHSFPDLSLTARHYKKSSAPKQDTDQNNVESQESDEGLQIEQDVEPLVPYSVTDILSEGCFLAQSEVDRLLKLLRTKKNLILQGAPGTGKTWLAKRLAFALMGERDDSKVRAVQFHPNFSYEDFVRGWRPAGDGKLVLADGAFMEAIQAASKEPSSKFVVVIEEINRGNPAQIFGELLTLLEAGKRTPSEALELCYSDVDGKRTPVHIPENLYVIGTMNIADRSLALVDFAFRRRFAFVTLEPKLGGTWRSWVVENSGVDPSMAPDIERRIEELNQKISEDLGTQFRIGQSYVTPAQPIELGATRDWFVQVVETEVVPLLEEYWFDAPKTVQNARKKLLEGW